MTNRKQLLLTIVAAVSIGFSPTFAGAQTSSFSAVGKGKPTLGLKSNGHDGQVADEYCRSDGGPLTVNVPWRCGAQFVADCKRLGGTISGPQPWGGQTCHTPS